MKDYENSQEIQDELGEGKFIDGTAIFEIWECDFNTILEYCELDIKNIKQEIEKIKNDPEFARQIEILLKQGNKTLEWYIEVETGEIEAIKRVTTNLKNNSQITDCRFGENRILCRLCEDDTFALFQYCIQKFGTYYRASICRT